MKLFSTSSLLIPITLKIITTPVSPKIIFLLFIEKRLRKFVIFDSWSFMRAIPFVGVIFNKVGRSVKVIIKDVIKPNVIIQPKSMIGLIPLKIRDRKANIVVKTITLG